MAKKAGKKPITWILLSDAMARAVNAYQKRDFAERQLWKWLLADELHWRSECLEGSKRNCDPGSGDPEFWHEPQFPSLHLRHLIITWDKSWVLRRWDDTHSYTFCRIEVAEDDLVKLLPAPPPRQQKTPRRRSLTKQDHVEAVAHELWPSGRPELTPAELLQQLGNELERRHIDASDTTQRRALGLRRD